MNRAQSAERTGQPAQEAMLKPEPLQPTQSMFRSVQERFQRWRLRLDEVILTRLPQFRDVVENQPPEPPRDSTPDNPLADKRRAAAAVIDHYAGLASANAFNPLPGVDIVVDVKILTSLCGAIADAYGLSSQQATALRDQYTARLLEYPALHQMVERLAPRLVQRVVVTTLSRAGLTLMAREAAKWVPLTGSVIAAGIGYRMVHSFGAQVCQECEVAWRRATPKVVSE